MAWEISHYLTVRTSEAPPQIFAVGMDEQGKQQWMGMRMLHLVDDTWLPFVETYNEKCPVINFRYFFLPYLWRREFIHSLLVGKISPGFLETFEVFVTAEKVSEYLDLLAEQSDKLYKQPMYATLLLFEKANAVLIGEAETSIHDFSQPLREYLVRALSNLDQYVTNHIG